MFANKITIPHWKSYIFDKATPAQHQDSKMKIVIILITQSNVSVCTFLIGKYIQSAYLQKYYKLIFYNIT